MATKTNTTVNGNDYFRIQRVVGHKNGKPVRKSFYGKSKAEAQKKYDEYKEAQVRKKYEHDLRADLSTFSDLAEEFIESVLKTSLRYTQGTTTRYLSAYTTHIKGSKLAKQIMSDLRPSDIQGFYNDLDVSQQTLRQVHKFMAAFFKWLVRNEYTNDILAAVEMPRKRDAKKHEDIVVWTNDEIMAITENADSYRYKFFIYVLLYTGMRFSEALALEYADIYDNTIHVKRQCYMGEIKEPKAGSVRDIPMHPVLVEEYERHREWHKREMQKKHYRTPYVFTTSTGNLIHRSSLDKSLRRYYNRIGILPKHTHAYRSTFCTQLCRSGVPIEVAAKLLGHKNITVTAKHYALVQPASKKEAINMLSYSFQKEIKSR